MKKASYVLVGLAVLALAACEDETTTATLGGAAIGAGLGMAVSNDDDKEEGALVGAGLGALIAQSMAKQSQSQQVQSPPPQQYQPAQQSRADGAVAAHNYAVQKALENGSPERWSYDNSSGTIYPTGSWTEYGLVCRGYDSIWSDGVGRGSNPGRACRQPNGYWKPS